jgi:7-carboxy-7-deazaguanine synthase
MIPLPNTQPVEKQTTRDDGGLDVIDYWPTIQGEGPFVGRVAVFVRLAGCNLQCPGCDTDYTSNRRAWAVEPLAAEVLRLTKEVNTKLIVLTGGEPFRQNITPLVRQLTYSTCKVQIETNGTLSLPDFPYFSDNIHVVASPKTPVVEPNLWSYVTYAKYVLQAGRVSEHDGLPTSVLGNGLAPARPPDKFGARFVYVQPMDENDPAKNKANTDACVQSALKFGYTVSLQIHKLLGVK